MSQEQAGRDRLRELLDAVLDEDNHTLDDMAGDAYSSPYHFSRQLSRGAGEPPVAMKRRVMLERAAWQLRQGASVTDTAFEAGYESVEGFSRAFARAFGHAPSAAAKASGSHWLPAPNGIHFHPPTSLWVHAKEQSMNPLTEQLVAHDLDDTRALLEAAKQLSDEDYRRPHLPRQHRARLRRPRRVRRTRAHPPGVHQGGLARSHRGHRLPAGACGRRRHAARPARGRGRALARHGAGHRPPRRMGRPAHRRPLRPARELRHEQRVAHVLTFSAHRRQLARQLLRASGQKVDSGDPINWLRARHGEAAEVEVQ